MTYGAAMAQGLNGFSTGGSSAAPIVEALRARGFVAAMETGAYCCFFTDAAQSDVWAAQRQGNESAKLAA